MKKSIYIFLTLVLALTLLVPTVFAVNTKVYYECANYELTASSDLKGDVPKTVKEVFTVTALPDKNSPNFEKPVLQIPANMTESFGKINSDRPATYSYVVSQNKGKNAKITYDTTKFKVVVDVTTNDQGLVSETHTITNTTTGKKVNEIRFINIYASDSPKTSDDNNLVLWLLVLAVLVVSGIGVGIAAVVIKRKEDHHNEKK